jgi:hypothetical protein
MGVLRYSLIKSVFLYETEVFMRIKRNEDINDHVIELRLQGFSSGLIAKILGTTRNAVMGRIHRMKQRGVILPTSENHVCAKKTKPEKESNIIEKNKVNKIDNLPLRIEDNDHPTEQSVDLFDLRPGHCKWPYGDGPFVFCGRECINDNVYCIGHRNIAYQCLGCNERIRERIIH